MVFLWVVGRRRSRNAFCTHSMNAANLRGAAYGAANSARSPGIPEHSWAPRGGGVSPTSLPSGVPHCTILACVRHVDGPTGRTRRKKKKRIWLAVRAAGAVTDAAIYTIFTFGRTKSRRLPTTLRNSAFAVLSQSAGWSRQGTTSRTQSISILMRALPAACASKLEEEGRQDPPLVTAPKPPLGTSAESPASDSAWTHQTETD